MTKNTWRREVVKICRECSSFADRGANRYRYQCTAIRKPVIPAAAAICHRTEEIFNAGMKLQNEAVQEAPDDLTGGLWQ